jgi:hypothetical protein
MLITLPPDQGLPETAGESTIEFDRPGTAWLPDTRARAAFSVPTMTAPVLVPSISELEDRRRFSNA